LFIIQRQQLKRRQSSLTEVRDGEDDGAPSESLVCSPQLTAGGHAFCHMSKLLAQRFGVNH
jgi:hypothetical protein